MYIAETPTSPMGNRAKIESFQKILEKKILFSIVNGITKSWEIVQQTSDMIKKKLKNILIAP